jgi:hypothetical protein
MNAPGAAVPPVQRFMAQRALEGASAGELAGLTVDAWRAIAAALAPVIGQLGVAALYRRSLHLAAATHPWLPSGNGGPSVGIDLDALEAALTARESAQAAAGGAALLLSFHALVGSLIGPSLSGQLLGAVWVKFFSGSAAQDPHP